VFNLQDGHVTQAVTSAMVALHKEHFGRGPTKARTNFAGPDTLVTVLEDALLPAEQALVKMGEQQRVRESRMFFQVATRAKWVGAVEEITGRSVYAFSSTTDPDRGMVMEVFVLERASGEGEQDGAS
jgi:uncharacterized protein YbcI